MHSCGTPNCGLDHSVYCNFGKTTLFHSKGYKVSCWLIIGKFNALLQYLLQYLQEGEVDCWPLQCPTLNCEYTAISEGECCPHCVSDPCLADNITYDIRKTCPDGYGITRLSGAVWTMVGSPCTTCKCKVRCSWWNGHGMYLIKLGSFSAPGGSHWDLGKVNETWGLQKTPVFSVWQSKSRTILSLLKMLNTGMLIS